MGVWREWGVSSGYSLLYFDGSFVVPNPRQEVPSHTQMTYG